MSSVKTGFPMEGESGKSLDEIPDEILEIIFQYLRKGDRSQCRLVCKTWNRLLDNNTIICISDAPWMMRTNISLLDREARFKSPFERRSYRVWPPGLRLYLPTTRCHGFSRGWILISMRGRAVVLWNPVSDAIHKLPPLPCRIIDAVGVQVFSLGSVECIVSVLGADGVLMCTTPTETEWTFFSTQLFPWDKYKRIMFNTRDQTLYLVGIYTTKSGWGNYLSTVDQIKLKDCHVPVRSLYIPVPHEHVRYTYMVESPAITQEEVLIVFSVLESISHKSVQQTKEFEVFSLSSSRQGELVRVESIGDKTIFLGSKGCCLVHNVRGVFADCICFYTNDAIGGHHTQEVLWNERQRGVFNLKEKKMQPESISPEWSGEGWFNPSSVF